jgi:hypothetical protein
MPPTLRKLVLSVHTRTGNAHTAPRHQQYQANGDLDVAGCSHGYVLCRGRMTFSYQFIVAVAVLQ